MIELPMREGEGIIGALLVKSCKFPPESNCPQTNLFITIESEKTAVKILIILNQSKLRDFSYF
ncbi:hypothetical protein [Epilithonimonas mollis]|uniref:hypothetical protein n=1 Tax=Epilithonimonas mollis TaxID=216903 RepID=UPI0009346331|nr:hypothetical protein [Epilithonimonas mollis]